MYNSFVFIAFIFVSILASSVLLPEVQEFMKSQVRILADADQSN